MQKIIRQNKLLAMVLLFSAIPSYAYIDPGMGGFLWQGFIAICVGLVFHILRFFGIVGNKKAAELTKESHGSDESNSKKAA